MTITKEQKDAIEAILKGVVPEGKVGVLVYSGADDVSPDALLNSVKAGLASGSLESGVTLFNLSEAAA